MRLIDADALRDSLPDEVSEFNQTQSMSIAALKYVIDAAPTVSCEECRYMGRWSNVTVDGDVYCANPRSLVTSATKRDFGCICFERRQG